jgi:hypothetical protein
MARSFSAWSHVVSMLFGQLTHAIGLNDVCDALRLHSGLLSALRGATAPSRNNLSHANKHRDAALAERFFWAVLEHLQKLSPGFATGRRGKGLARGICSDSVGQQVDIFAILLLPKAPISRDSLSQAVGTEGKFRRLGRRARCPRHLESSDRQR